MDTVFRKLSLSLYGLKFRELSLILNGRRPFIRHSENKKLNVLNSYIARCYTLNRIAGDTTR